ncbi:MAG: MGMT family protein [Chlorobi bacterium]|nr:MGMT family protein [Chlorobiota bacterium]
MQDNFYDKVFEVTRKIPVGKVTSYGAIAKFLGSAKSARMVGWALNKSSLHKEYVPAHRVVNRKGLLTGKNHFANQNTMIELLESEGIKVEDNKVVNFQEVFWQPE